MTKLSQCAKCKKDRRICGFYTPEDDTDCPHYRGARRSAILDAKDDVGCIWRMVLIIVVAVIVIIVNLSGVKVSFAGVASAIFGGVFVLLGIIWLIFWGSDSIGKLLIRIKTKKNMKKEQMKTDNTEEVEDVEIPVGNNTSGVSTRTLLQLALHSLNLQYEFDSEQNFIVRYQGETFRIIAENEDVYLQIQDLRWYDAPLDDIDNLSLVYRAVNACNMRNTVRLVYTYNRPENELYLHSLYDILWMSQIPDIDALLAASFEKMLRAHHLFFHVMEEIRREEFGRQNG